MSDPVRGLVDLAARLRAEGVVVTTDRVVTLCRATALVSSGESDALYWAAAATLVSSPDGLAALDRAVRDSAAAGIQPLPGTGRATAVNLPALAAEARDGRTGPARHVVGDVEVEGDASLRIVASRAETLRRKSFDQLTEAEEILAAAAIRRLAPHLPARRARRRRPARTGSDVDVRRTVRRSYRSGGEPFQRSWRARRREERRLVLLLDVSASMAPYTKALLLFGHSATSTGRSVEVFCFGTRLTRLTSAMRTRQPHRALADVATRVTDWEGGTRIGESIKALLDRYAATALLRGAVVVLCSDGLDRGDPEVLAAQVRRLARLAHRLVWVNPLKGSPRYEPLARGMAAALPHISAFLPGHNLASLDELCHVLAAS